MISFDDTRAQACSPAASVRRSSGETIWCRLRHFQLRTTARFSQPIIYWMLSIRHYFSIILPENFSSWSDGSLNIYSHTSPRRPLHIFHYLIFIAFYYYRLMTLHAFYLLNFSFGQYLLKQPHQISSQWLCFRSRSHRMIDYLRSRLRVMFFPWYFILRVYSTPRRVESPCWW